MRLFTGIAIPPHVQLNLERLLACLRPTAHLQWSPVYNLHVTTKFIGEWPQERLPELTGALEQVPAPAPFTLDMEGLGWFPNPHRPRVFWAAVQRSEPLAQLAAHTEDKLAGLGIAKEERAYSPHLTLARVRTEVPLVQLRETIAKLPSVHFGSFQVDRYCLYQSQQGPNGTIYNTLAEYPLPAA